MARELLLSRGRSSLALLALALGSVGCGPPTTASARSPYEIIAKERVQDGPAVPVAVTQYEWSIALDRLARLRRGRPDKPYVERIRLAIGDPRTGRQYQARGAVAVSPGVAARMILLGPGGTTALDVWVTKERFRFSVPALALEKRGGTEPAAAKGLPIGMLRWNSGMVPTGTSAPSKSTSTDFSSTPASFNTSARRTPAHRALATAPCSH